jgi:adenosylhomocysteinase
MRAMKDRAIVCNIGHFDRNPGSERCATEMAEVKPQVDEVEFPDGKRLIVLAKAASSTWAAAPATRAFVMSASFTNQDAGADRALE